MGNTLKYIKQVEEILEHLLNILSYWKILHMKFQVEKKIVGDQWNK